MHYFHDLAIFWSAKKRCKHTFSPTLHPLSTVIFATATVLAFVLHRNSRFNFHCYTQREATPTQKLARKCTVTSRNILHERLQSTFTLANQLRWTAQYKLTSEQWPVTRGKWMSSSPTPTHLRAMAHEQRKMDVVFTWMDSPQGSGPWPKKNGCLLHQLTSGQWPVTKEKWMPSSPTPTHLRAMAHEQRKMDVVFTWMNSPQGNGHDQRKMDVFFTWMNSPQGSGPWPKATENGCLLHLHLLPSGQWTMTQGKKTYSSYTPTHLRAVAHDQRKMNVFFIWPNSPEGNSPRPKVNRHILHLAQLTSGQWLATKGKWMSSSSISRSFRRQSARLET